MSGFSKIWRSKVKVDFRSMRLLPIAVLFLAALTTVFGQGQSPDLFRTVRPQLMITIRRDPNGSAADLLELKSTDADYPPLQLQQQILKLGESLNSQPRGLSFERHAVAANMSSVRATCAIDNVIDRKTGQFHLTEIARAFAGGEAGHQVTGLSLSFLGERPGKKTLLAFGTEADGVQVQGDYNATFGSIEYRVKLNSQDPARISIPEGGEQNAPQRPSSDGRNSVDWSLWGLIAIAAIAVGALVYSLLIRTATSKRS